MLYIIVPDVAKEVEGQMVEKVDLKKKEQQAKHIEVQERLLWEQVNAKMTYLDYK